jgi:hypothetical protein
MSEWVRQKVLEILRVPPEPGVPEGTPASVLTFRAGRNLYRWLVLRWAFSHLGVVAGAIFAYYFTWRLIALGPKWLQFLYGAAEVAGLFGGLDTPVSMAIVPIANQEKVPFMGPWAAGTPITQNQPARPCIELSQPNK